MDESVLQQLLDDVFDQALVYHGFTDYLRDYELVVYCTADPSTGIAPSHERYLFKLCVQAMVETAVPEEFWARSLDERLLDHDASADLDGYVWGVKWQVLYPGARVVDASERAQHWTEALDLPFHEVRIETNGHNISLVFSELVVDTVEPGHSPFTVGTRGPDFKIPLE